MREVSAREMELIGGGEDWLTVSCCSVNLFGVTIEYDGFSFGIPNSERTIGDEFLELNNGNLR